MHLSGSPPTVDLTYSDVFLVPRRSGVTSRLDVDLSPGDGTSATIPLVASNMNSVTGPRLAAALQKTRQGRPVAPQVLAELQKGARTHLSCHERGRLLLIPAMDILYLKADLKYVTARTAAREYLLDESLTHLEQEFSERFIRLHRSVLVARDAIAGFEKCAAEDAETQWQALLRGVPETLPVSRRQWPLVKSYARQLSS